MMHPLTPLAYIFEITPRTFTTFFLMVLTRFIIAKVFMQDLKLTLKEVIAVFIFIFLNALIRTFPMTYFWMTHEHHDYFAFFSLAATLLLLLSLFIYLRKIKGIPLKKSIIFAIFADLIYGILHYLVDFIVLQITGCRHVDWFDPTTLLFFLYRPLIVIAFSVLLAFFLIKMTRKLQQQIDGNARIGTVFMFASLIGWSSYQFIFFARFIPAGGYSVLWLPALLFVYVAVSFISFFFYIGQQNAKSTLQKKEIEQESMLFYMNEIEQQQASLRKFKHDYQNILLSLEDYLDSDDIAGLREYYSTKIRTASETIIKQNFSLSRLSHIKVKEIKSILTAKLARAQNIGIDVSFQAFDDIDHISVDSVTLVRILGIILDNAIEELEMIENGKLQVACFKHKEAITFVVDNTCRADTPPLHQLKETGFSTKGKGRGLGLSNLTELVNAQPDIILHTNMTKRHFIQKLTIGEE